MIVCPNCGASNADGSRYCSNCGASLAGLTAEDGGPAPDAAPDTEPEALSDAASARRSPMPPPVDLPAPSRPVSSRPATDPEWRMSDPGPLPPPRGRRKWLWIAGGIVGACLLVCCLFWVWASTLGADWIEDIGTEISEQLTETPEETEAPGE